MCLLTRNVNFQNQEKCYINFQIALKRVAKSQKVLPKVVELNIMIACKHSCLLLDFLFSDAFTVILGREECTRSVFVHLISATASVSSEMNPDFHT